MDFVSDTKRIRRPDTCRVPLDEAKTALDSGSAILVDVRSAEAYRDSHIAGAINIPLAELESRLGELDKAQWIITSIPDPAENQAPVRRPFCLKMVFKT